LQAITSSLPGAQLPFNDGMVGAIIVQGFEGWQVSDFFTVDRLGCLHEREMKIQRIVFTQRFEPRSECCFHCVEG